MTNLLNSIFDSTQTVAMGPFLICMGVSLIIGILFALVYERVGKSSQSFVLTLALLPAVVAVVIMMVNGNVGAGVAVAGAFSLVRFRSVPGTAKEITMLFMAMGAGLITGMGYLLLAVTFTVFMLVAYIIFSAAGLGKKRGSASEKVLKVTIPEDLNYGHLFDDLMEKYTTKNEVVSVKTTNMGSMFKLTYHLVLRDEKLEKEFIDELRCRNGNLEISITRQEAGANEL